MRKVSLVEFGDLIDKLVFYIARFMFAYIAYYMLQPHKLFLKMRDVGYRSQKRTMILSQPIGATLLTVYIPVYTISSMHQLSGFMVILNVVYTYIVFSAACGMWLAYFHFLAEQRYNKDGSPINPPGQIAKTYEQYRATSS